MGRSLLPMVTIWLPLSILGLMVPLRLQQWPPSMTGMGLLPQVFYCLVLHLDWSNPGAGLLPPFLWINFLACKIFWVPLQAPWKSSETWGPSPTFSCLGLPCHRPVGLPYTDLRTPGERQGTSSLYSWAPYPHLKLHGTCGHGSFCPGFISECRRTVQGLHATFYNFPQLCKSLPSHARAPSVCLSLCLSFLLLRNSWVEQRQAPHLCVLRESSGETNTGDCTTILPPISYSLAFASFPISFSFSFFKNKDKLLIFN